MDKELVVIEEIQRQKLALRAEIEEVQNQIKEAKANNEDISPLTDKLFIKHRELTEIDNRQTQTLALAIPDESYMVLKNMVATFSSIVPQSPEYATQVEKLCSLSEAHWSIDTALNSNLPKFRKVSLSEELPNYWKAVARIIERFLRRNNITWSEDQIFGCAMDLTEKCILWNIADVICFMKYIRQNPKNNPQIRIYSTFTPADLLRMVQYYNEEQAIIKETIEHEKKHLANIAPPQVITLVDKSGQPMKKLDYGKVINKIADNLETGIKPKTAFEKARFEHDVKKEIEKSEAPAWKKEKEEREFRENISKKTIEHFKDENQEKDFLEKVAKDKKKEDDK